MSERSNYPKGLARRREIVETALELFSRKGYDRTSVREIARLCGLSQAGLLHHFRSKEELFLEVLRRRDDRNERFYDEDEQHSVTVEGLRHIVEHNAAEPGLVRLYVAMSAESTGDDSETRQFFAARYEKLRENVAADVRRRQSTGEISSELEAVDIATLLIAAADGLQTQWLLEPDKIQMGARLTDLTKLLSARDLRSAD